MYMLPTQLHYSKVIIKQINIVYEHMQEWIVQIIMRMENENSCKIQNHIDI